MRRRLIAPCLLFLCALLAGAAHARDAAPVVLEPGLDPATAAASLVTLTDALTLKGLKRVAVPQFAIEFVTQDNVKAETSGFAAAGRASVAGYYRLVGVAEPQFQALAEQLYAAFVQALQAQGLEVVGQEELAASPTWRRLVAAGDAMPVRGDSAITVGPPGMALYGLNRMQAAAGQKGLMGSLTQLSVGFSAVSAATDNMTLQQELGGAALLEVTMRLHFAQLTNESKGFFGRLGSTAAVSAKVHPIVTQARLTVQAGARSSVLSTKAPLLLDPEAFLEMRKEATTKADVAGAIVVGLLRMASGSGDSSSYEKYEVVTEPERYRERVGAGLTQTGALLIARMVGER
jgi:hypothetical protein